MKRFVTGLSVFLLSGFIYATPLHNVVIFGDSLSDNGNLYEVMKHQLPQSPPYFAGRFSNGPVWIEHLVASYFPADSASHLFNYAYGGAGVTDDDVEEDVLFTLKREIDIYLLAHQDKLNEDSLYVVWIGANNYLGMPENVDETLQVVNGGITHSLQHMVEKGAKHILVLNLPDLGKTPAAIEFDNVQVMSHFSTQHNQALEQTVTSLKQTYPAVNWLYFDMNKAFGEVLDHASEYGITNTTGTCYSALMNEGTKRSVLKMVASVKPKATLDACDGYLFFDLVHPSALAHKLMAEKARIMLDAAGVELSN